MYKRQVAGLIYSGFGGMLAGPALLDILSGAVNPSGKDVYKRQPHDYANYFPTHWKQDVWDMVEKDLSLIHI